MDAKIPERRFVLKRELRRVCRRDRGMLDEDERGMGVGLSFGVLSTLILLVVR